MHKTLLSAVTALLLAPAGVPAAVEEEDLQADYTSDINRPAEARANNVFSAWGDNMANLIESGHRDGIVVDGKDYSDGRVHVDGVGNMIVDRHAQTGAVINNTKLHDTTVILMKDKQHRMK